MGSRLFEVTDIHSKETHPRRRFRVALRWLAGLILIAIVGSWLFLYIDSVYQRRRAEALFADLKSLDFATAGFPEVRDIVIRNGGHVGSTCNPQNCTFSLQIMTLLPRIMTRQTRIQLLDRHPEFFYRTLSYIGVRSWNLRAIFEIRNGKLEGSFTGVFEIRMERLDSSGNRYFVPRGYGVTTRSDAVTARKDASRFDWGSCGSQDYKVYISHGVFKLPQNTLETCVVQSAGASVKRAFDIHLRCLNGLFRSCRFDELAPSAWADYTAKDGTGTRDPRR